MGLPPAIQSPPPLPTEEEEQFPALQVVLAISAAIAFIILLLFLFLSPIEKTSQLGGNGNGVGGSGVTENGNAGGNGGEGDKGQGKGSSNNGRDQGGGTSSGGSGKLSSEEEAISSKNGAVISTSPNTVESSSVIKPNEDVDRRESNAVGTPTQKQQEVAEVQLPKVEPQSFYIPQPEVSRVEPQGEMGSSAEFFGASADGDEFAYIVDVSSSMAGNRFEKARNELIDSLNKLNKRQKVFIVFFNDQTHVQPIDKLLALSKRNKERLNEWISRASPRGGTDPRDALLMAIGKRPDAIFVLSDGDFADSIVNEITIKNTKKIPIHTIGFQTSASTLQILAEKNRGIFKRVD